MSIQNSESINLNELSVDVGIAKVNEKISTFIQKMHLHANQANRCFIYNGLADASLMNSNMGSFTYTYQ